MLINTIDQAVIYVGGFGTRIKKITKKIPKPLIKVNKKPFLDHIIKNLSRHGFSEVILLCYYKSSIFFKKYHNKIVHNIKIKCIKEKEPLDTGGALLNAKKILKKNFLLCNGDTYFDINLNDLCYNFFKFKSGIFIAIKKSKNNSRYDELFLKNNKIILSNKKNKKYSLLNSGYYVVSKGILKYFKKKCSLENDIFKILIKNNKMYGKVYNKPNNEFIDIGVYRDLNKSSSFIKKINYKSALFLDRDGVINKDTGYVYKAKDLIWKKNIIKFIKNCNDNGRYVFVVSNQSGVGRGYYTINDVYFLHKWINNELRKKGAHIDQFYFAPYFKHSNLKRYRTGIKLRKPNVGMIKQACKDWDINLKKSRYIGDQNVDKLTASKLNIKFSLIKFDQSLSDIF